MKVCEQASDLEVAGLPLPWWGTPPFMVRAVVGWGEGHLSQSWGLRWIPKVSHLLGEGLQVPCSHPWSPFPGLAQQGYFLSLPSPLPSPPIMAPRSRTQATSCSLSRFPIGL